MSFQFKIGDKIRCVSGSLAEFGEEYEIWNIISESIFPYKIKSLYDGRSNGWRQGYIEENFMLIKKKNHPYTEIFK